MRATTTTNIKKIYNRFPLIIVVCTWHLCNIRHQLEIWFPVFSSTLFSLYGCGCRCYCYNLLRPRLLFLLQLLVLVGNFSLTKHKFQVSLEQANIQTVGIVGNVRHTQQHNQRESENKSFPNDKQFAIVTSLSLITLNVAHSRHLAVSNWRVLHSAVESVLFAYHTFKIDRSCRPLVWTRLLHDANKFGSFHSQFGEFILLHLFSHLAFERVASSD